MDIVRRDLMDMGTNWDEAKELDDKQSRIASTCAPMPPSV